MSSTKTPHRINYLETAHHSVAWFNDRHQAQQLEMAPPFQRKPVWTTPQKAYLIDTILRGLPVPEMYIVDRVDERGAQEHVIVDGQQRLRACLEFIEGRFTLDADESPDWGAAAFDDLSPEAKKKFFSYKFVIRNLPELPQPQLRDIFKRLNRNTVALNAQELRHATYWGRFIRLVEDETETNAFWADSGVFSAAQVRRMLDVEFVSELAVGILHGPQEKKKKLDDYYTLYEEEFEREEDLREIFRSVTGELGQLLPELRTTRWKRKSDFYTLFLTLADRHGQFPFASDVRTRVSAALIEFGEGVSAFLAADEVEDPDAPSAPPPPQIARYSKAVARASTDLSTRRTRQEILGSIVDEAVKGRAI